MKAYIFTINETYKRNEAVVYHIRIYRVINGIPVLIHKDSDSFVSTFQLFIESMERGQKSKAIPTKHWLPPKAFRKGETGTWNYNCWSLEFNKLAKVTQI